MFHGVLRGRAGERRYRLVAYGESGPIGALDGLRVTVAAGPLEAAPEATIAATPLAVGLHVDAAGGVQVVR